MPPRRRKIKLPSELKKRIIEDTNSNLSMALRRIGRFTDKNEPKLDKMKEQIEHGVFADLTPMYRKKDEAERICMAFEIAVRVFKKTSRSRHEKAMSLLKGWRESLAAINATIPVIEQLNKKNKLGMN